MPSTDGLTTVGHVPWQMQNLISTDIKLAASQSTREAQLSDRDDYNSLKRKGSCKESMHTHTHIHTNTPMRANSESDLSNGCILKPECKQ